MSDMLILSVSEKKLSEIAAKYSKSLRVGKTLVDAGIIRCIVLFPPDELEINGIYGDTDRMRQVEFNDEAQRMRFMMEHL